MTGFTPRTSQMLDLSDHGHTPESIAKVMGIKPASVRRTLSLYGDGISATRAHEREMERGSKQLLAAMNTARQAARRGTSLQARA